VDVYKLSLEDALVAGTYTTMNVTVHGKMRWAGNQSPVTDLRFLPGGRQTWGEYMGIRGDNVYVD